MSWELVSSVELVLRVRSWCGCATVCESPSWHFCPSSLLSMFFPPVCVCVQHPASACGACQVPEDGLTTFCQFILSLHWAVWARAVLMLCMGVFGFLLFLYGFLFRSSFRGRSCVTSVGHSVWAAPELFPKGTCHTRCPAGWPRPVLVPVGVEAATVQVSCMRNLEPGTCFPWNFNIWV